MRINIKGNAVTPDAVAAALQTCEKEYGLKIKSATLYVRFEDDLGQTVEPTQDGAEFVQDFVFTRTKEASTQPVPKLPTESKSIRLNDAIALCEQAACRSLAKSEVQRIAELTALSITQTVFEKCINKTISNIGEFRIRYFEKVVLSEIEKTERA